MTTRFTSVLLTILFGLILWGQGVLRAQESAAAQSAQRLASCCGGQQAVGVASSSDSGGQESRVGPRLRPSDLAQLRLPDVRITSAVHHAGHPGRVGGRINVSHVDVKGTIGGTIRFELLLPDQWNSRFVMGGGGGFVGRVSNFARSSINQGYATVGTDTGHQAVLSVVERKVPQGTEERRSTFHTVLYILAAAHGQVNVVKLE